MVGLNRTEHDVQNADITAPFTHLAVSALTGVTLCSFSSESSAAWLWH